MNTPLEEHLKVAFFTATIYNWNLLLLPNQNKQIILKSLKYLVEDNRIKLYGFVIMPNHIHLLLKVLAPWKLSEVKRDFLKYTGQQMKFSLIRADPEYLELFRVNNIDRKYQFWKRNSLTVLLDDRKLVEQKLDYIHNNPVQKRWLLAKSPDEYYFSSYNYYELESSDHNFLSHYMECFE